MNSFQLNTYTIKIRRYGRKTQSILEGLEDDLDLRYIAKCLRRELKCSAAHKKDKKTDTSVIVLSGDKSVELSEWLVKSGIARKDEIRIRGV